MVLPSTICIDVGASYFPHTSWWFFLESPRSRCIAVYPNSENLIYSQFWPWKAEIQLIKNGLSEFGGPMTLYKTNMQSGSSLLKPMLNESNLLRFKQVSEYFLPIQELLIDTVTIAELVSHFECGPIIIKLDTQGSELSIVRGFLESNPRHIIVGIEIECSLLSLPNYEGAPRLWEVAAYLEEKGFELLNLDVFPQRKTKSKYGNKSRIISGECDAVFALRRERMTSLNVETKICLLGFYITNAFFHEALSLLKKDDDIQTYLNSRDFKIERLVRVLQRR